MAENDLSIIVKTQVEVDESQAQKELKGFSDRISRDTNSQLKVPFDIDRAATMKNIRTAIKDIQGQLKDSKLKIEIETPKVKQVQSAIQKASASLFNEKAASQYWNSRFKDSVKGLTSPNRALEQLNKQYAQREKEANRVAAASQKAQSQYWNARFKDSVKGLTEQNDQLKQMSKYYAQMEKEASKAAETANKFKQTANNKASEIDSKQIAKIAQLRKTLNAGGYEKSTTSGFQSLYSQLNTLENKFKEVQKSLQSDTLTESQFAEYTAELKSLEAQLTSTGNMVKNFNGSLASQNYVAKMQSNIGKLKSDFAELEANWTKAFEIPELRTQIEEFRVKLADVDAVNFNQIKSEFIELKSNIRAAGADCQSFGQQVKGIVSKMVGLVSVADVFMAIKRGATTAIENVKALDSAMVELKKVTDLTDRAYDKFLDNAGSRAKDIGTTFVDYVSGVADFSRLGYDLQDATTMAEAANIYYKVGDQISNIEEATESLISTTQAYGYTASDVMTVVDKLNAAGNTMAISSGGIGVALQHSAAALSAANNTLDESIALIAAANRVVQDPNAVGNMWKTVSMRIRSAKSELEAAGEDTDGLVESTAKLRDLVKGITNFDILEADGKAFKSTKDIIVGIGKEWKNLEDLQQASLLEALAGKRQGNALAAVLNNMDDIKKSMDVTQNSAGSAMNEHARWLQSIEASEAQAAAAFEELSSKIMSSDLVKGFYDTETNVIGFLSDIIDLTDSAIPLVSSLAAGLLSLKGNFGISKVNMPYPTFLGAVA